MGDNHANAHFNTTCKFPWMTDAVLMATADEISCRAYGSHVTWWLLFKVFTPRQQAEHCRCHKSILPNRM
jgi:hypothetical protein